MDVDAAVTLFRYDIGPAFNGFCPVRNILLDGDDERDKGMRIEHCAFVDASLLMLSVSPPYGSDRPGGLVKVHLAEDLSSHAMLGWLEPPRAEDVCGPFIAANTKTVAVLPSTKSGYPTRTLRLYQRIDAVSFVAVVELKDYFVMQPHSFWFAAFDSSSLRVLCDETRSQYVIQDVDVDVLASASPCGPRPILRFRDSAYALSTVVDVRGTFIACGHNRPSLHAVRDGENLSELLPRHDDGGDGDDGDDGDHYGCDYDTRTAHYLPDVGIVFFSSFSEGDYSTVEVRREREREPGTFARTESFKLVRAP